MNIAAFVIALITGLHGLMTGHDYLTLAHVGRGIAEFGRSLGDSSMVGEMNQIYLSVLCGMLGAILGIVGGGLSLAKKRIPAVILLLVAAGFSVLSFYLGWRTNGYTAIWSFAYLTAAMCFAAPIDGIAADETPAEAPQNVPSVQKKIQEKPHMEVGKAYEPILGLETGALIKRANLFLEDGDFDEAARYFEQAANQDPENPLVYFGKLMIEKGAYTLEELTDLATPLEEEKLFQRALRFADGEIRTRLEGYSQVNRSKIEQREAEKAAHIEELYAQALTQMKGALASPEIQGLKETLSSLQALVSYKDTEALAQEIQSAIEQEEKYIKAVEAQERAANIAEFQDVAGQFEELGDYKDSRARMEEARAALEELATAQKEARERRAQQVKTIKDGLRGAMAVGVKSAKEALSVGTKSAKEALNAAKSYCDMGKQKLAAKWSQEGAGTGGAEAKAPAKASDELELLKDAAEQGNTEAQYRLGWMYQTGKGVEKDPRQSAEWYRRAAEQGFSKAQASLGNCYYNGEGVPKDFEQAIFWWHRAAKQGSAAAQYNIGIMYATGRGVEKDLDKAREWYQKSAEQGNESAKKALERLK